MTRRNLGIGTSVAAWLNAGACVALLTSLCVPAAEAAAGWEPAAFSGEGKRTVQGCATKFTDDSYVCLFVRCDETGRLSLHATAPGPDITGPVRFSIDGTAFPVTFVKSPASPLPLSHRAESFPEPLLSAMKFGRTLKILDANLTAGYDVIPLRNAGTAIGRIEKACGNASDAR